MGGRPMGGMIGWGYSRYRIYHSAIEVSNFYILLRPTSNCDFLHLCRLKNLGGTLAGGYIWVVDLWMG